MKFTKSLLAIFLFMGCFTISCDNDIDLIAPYKEIAVVYGLINPADSIHIIRIQKAFLGPGNANVMSQVTDSTYYPDILDATLQRVKNGAVLQSIPLTRFIAPDKQDGFFPSSPNILYKTNGETIFRDSEYRLIVKNRETGYQVTATTPIVDSLRVIHPSVFSSNSVQFAGLFPYTVEYTSAKNGKVYNLTIRFKYTEEIIANGTLIPKYIDWVFPNDLVSDPTQITTFLKEIDGENFYKFVGQKLKVDNTVRRYAGTLDFIFTSGAEFLANYISINSATTSVLTSIPEYSNVEGGTGIFSSRFIQVSPNKPLDATSLNLLKTSPYTSALGFQ